MLFRSHGCFKWFVVKVRKLKIFLLKQVEIILLEEEEQFQIPSVEMGQVFPGFLSQILREGFSEFGKSMKGYLTNEAILHAPESRTSSPVRIPRDEITLEHLQIKGLYPCGEGAGYAGGIISAAIDGEKCALRIGEVLK